jgi:hypothetical protein
MKNKDIINDNKYTKLKKKTHWTVKSQQISFVHYVVLNKH